MLIAGEASGDLLAAELVSALHAQSSILHPPSSPVFFGAGGSRMAAAGVRFARLPATLLFWRDHPERATRTLEEYAAQAMRRCKLHHLRRGFLKGVEELVIAGAGLEARAWQRLLLAEGVAVTSWLDIDPRKVGTVLHGAAVLRPEELQLGSRKMITAIGLRGAREQFRLTAGALGWQEGVDFVSVA